MNNDVNFYFYYGMRKFQNSLNLDYGKDKAVVVLFLNSSVLTLVTT